MTPLLRASRMLPLAITPHSASRHHPTRANARTQGPIYRTWRTPHGASRIPAIFADAKTAGQNFPTLRQPCANARKPSRSRPTGAPGRRRSGAAAKSGGHPPSAEIEPAGEPSRRLAPTGDDGPAMTRRTPARSLRAVPPPSGPGAGAPIARMASSARREIARNQKAGARSGCESPATFAELAPRNLRSGKPLATTAARDPGVAALNHDGSRFVDAAALAKRRGGRRLAGERSNISATRRR